MRCSACGGTPEDGMMQHARTCEFWLPPRPPGNPLFTHPDLVDWDANVSWLYPDEGWAAS